MILAAHKTNEPSFPIGCNRIPELEVSDRKYLIKGEWITVMEGCSKYNIILKTVKHRVSERGYSLDDALTLPLNWIKSQKRNTGGSTKEKKKVIMDAVNDLYKGDGLTTKEISKKLNRNMSRCRDWLKILNDEGFLTLTKGLGGNAYWSPKRK